jgi:hypothetical protein
VFLKAPSEKSTSRLMPRDYRIGWDSVACNHVFLTVWLQRERCESLQSVAIVERVFISMVMSVVENGNGSQDTWTSKGGSSHGGDVRLADLWLGSAASTNGGGST